MCENKDELLLLQIMGASFPVGGFTHSFGLETMISKNVVHDAVTMKEYLVSRLLVTEFHFEGPSFVKGYCFGKNNDFNSWEKLDQEITAMRLTKESREASLKMGRAFWRICNTTFNNQDITRCFELIRSDKMAGNYAVGAGMLCGLFHVNLERACNAYLFSVVNNSVQAGVKLIPLGQSEGQRIIFELSDDINEISKKLAEGEGQEELYNFAPFQDIMSMQHERLYTRLYIS